MTDHHTLTPAEMSFVEGGPTHFLLKRIGLGDKSLRGRLLRAFLILLVTWLPLVVLSWFAGHAVGDRVAIPFFRDPEVHVRFLFVVPLLGMAEWVVAAGLAMQTRHLIESGIIPESELGRFRAARDSAATLRNSLTAEVVIIGIALSIALVSRLYFGVSEGFNSWERIPLNPVVATDTSGETETKSESKSGEKKVDPSSRVTPAGWWCIFISLPCLFFFLLRWIWVFLIWGWFLIKISRLDLELTPTHPDRTGGLGFLGWGLASFAMVVMAISAVMSAGLADEIMNHGSTLEERKYHVMLFVITVLLVIHAPMLAFTGKLLRCRFSGLLDIGALAWRHDRAFDEKWIKNRGGDDSASLLGSPDIQSLADMGTCYEHVNRMLPIPFDVKAFAVLVLAALLPMVPLLWAEVPMTEIFQKLGELLF